VIDQRGATQVVDARGFTWVPARWWRSPRTGLRYPVSVTVQIPSAGLTVDVRPLLDEQELRLSVQYWEGAVAARGNAARASITGAGYLELTGYAASP
jgi:predicted secreted hydrolase